MGSVGYFESRGFVVARDDPAKKEAQHLWKARGFQPTNGTYVVGDLILMFTPNEVWDRYEAQNLSRAKRQIDEPKRNFKDVAKNLEHIKVFVPED